MPARLTTHVLDTTQGRPAAGVAVELWRRDAAGTWERLGVLRTGADGRAEAPLLIGDELIPGTFEMVFDVGAYFAVQPVVTAEAPFLSHVPVRFNITDPHAHYHVPLLVSPWSYTTYRGS
jgi:5-hydroxyisourate hydrolase